MKQIDWGSLQKFDAAELVHEQAFFSCLHFHFDTCGEMIFRLQGRLFAHHTPASIDEVQ